MNDQNYIIRAAGFEDSDPIFDLIRQFTNELLPRPMSDIVKNIDRFLVCEADGKVAGCVSWQILPEIGAPRNPTVEIKSLAVDKAHHRAGVGTSLVRSAIHRIEQLHPTQIVVLTFAPVFFATLGFKEVRKETLIHKIYSGCVNCTKYDSPLTCPEVAMVLNVRKRTKESPEDQALRRSHMKG